MADALYTLTEPLPTLRSITHINTENGRYAFPAGALSPADGEFVALRASPDRMTTYVCKGPEAAKLREQIEAGGTITWPSKVTRLDLVRE